MWGVDKAVTARVLVLVLQLQLAHRLSRELIYISKTCALHFVLLNSVMNFLSQQTICIYFTMKNQVWSAMTREPFILQNRTARKRQKIIKIIRNIEECFEDMYNTCTILGNHIHILHIYTYSKVVTPR